MSRIKGRDTAIEGMLRKALLERGVLGYRKNTRGVLGKPDFTWKRHKLAVFCDSAFWHGYNWNEKARRVFKVRKKFWIRKIERNRERDKEVNRGLRKEGWTVLRFWDRQIKKSPETCARKVRQQLDRLKVVKHA